MGIFKKQKENKAKPGKGGKAWDLQIQYKYIKIKKTTYSAIYKRSTYNNHTI